MVANDETDTARGSGTVGRSGRLHVFQLLKVRERSSVRLYGGSSAFRARRGPDCQGDRRLSCEPWARWFSVRATIDSCCGSGPQGLPPLAARYVDADFGGVSASVDDCVQQDLERRFIVRTAVHAGVNRIADAVDTACLRDGC